MIRSLKIKFVALAMTALFILLSLVVFGMNLLNYNSIVSDADEVLRLLVQNKGDFPEFKNDPGMGRHFPRGFSAETPYESRFFSVIFDSSGQIINTNTSRVSSVDDVSAAEYAQKVYNKGSDSGFMNEYRYIRYTEVDGEHIIFLNCSQKLSSYYQFFCASIIMALAGFAAVFVAVSFFAGRILRPVAESYEKQKRFITDAGHEIKTPLTIINANAELLEMEIGENESIADIRQQTKRLRTLTDDLVMLARMEETENAVSKIDFPISEVVAEAIAPFNALAQQQGKSINANIQPMLSYNGDSKSIQQLVSILTDNAIKYSAAGKTIEINMSRQNRSICLSVFNQTTSEMQADDVAHVFERFYRSDRSRNSETGGHGIGLSIAKAIVSAHGGKIQAEAQDGFSFKITVTLPD